jgi:dihydrolipoamide dehydrogenase
VTLSEAVDIVIPDIGDFEDVEVIEILVSPGDRVEREDSLITIESDKASMEIPSPARGTVREVCVALGSRVSEGSLVLRIEAEDSAATDPVRAETPPAQTTADVGAAARPAAQAAHDVPASDFHAEVVVLGGGPGGYTAAFRAADLGKKVILIERHEQLGGVCLNVGCIPSKALLHVAEVVNEARELESRGIRFGAPQIDLDQLRAFKDQVVGGLTQGLQTLAKRRNVTVMRGVARFSQTAQLQLDGAEGTATVSFDDCIIAVGSESIELPGVPHADPRVIDSTGALMIQDVPERMLVVGGGIIGLEMATVYDALGTRISVVELTDSLIPGCDRDLVKPLQRRIAKRYENIYTGTKVTRVAPEDAGLRVFFEGDDAPDSDLFDRVLVAVGRRPNGKAIGADLIGLEVDENGYIPVDTRMRTNVAHVYAIGDVVGQPMLAHKATHEGKTAAEVIAGLPAEFDRQAIPSVAYTDPEIAWMGLSESDASAQGIEIEKAAFPWAASGRAQGIGRAEGVTKLVFEAGSRRLLGAGIVGRNAGELIAEAVLGLEMGADAEDLGLTVHPHPTLSETLNFASEMVEGTITDLYLPKRKPKKS